MDYVIFSLFFYIFLLEIKSSELLYDFFGRLIRYVYCFDALIINMFTYLFIFILFNYAMTIIITSNFKVH